MVINWPNETTVVEFEDIKITLSISEKSEGVFNVSYLVEFGESVIKFSRICKQRDMNYAKASVVNNYLGHIRTELRKVGLV